MRHVLIFLVRAGRERSGLRSGWAVVENSKLSGRIYLHLADDSAFRAIKSK